MEAERTRVNVARERAVVVHQEAQTEHKRAVMMVMRSSMLRRISSCAWISSPGELSPVPFYCLREHLSKHMFSCSMTRCHMARNMKQLPCHARSSHHAG